MRFFFLVALLAIAVKASYANGDGESQTFFKRRSLIMSTETMGLNARVLKKRAAKKGVKGGKRGKGGAPGKLKNGNGVGKATKHLPSFPTEEEYCPTGEEACCGIDFIECRDLVFSFQISFQEDVIGDVTWDERKRGPIVPMNEILDRSVRRELVGEYLASTIPAGKYPKQSKRRKDGETKLFSFTIDEVIKTTQDILDEISLDPELSPDTIPNVANLDIKFTLFNGHVADSPFKGLAISYIDPKKEKFEGFLYAFDETEPVSRRRKLQFEIEVSCSDAFDFAQSLYECPDPAASLTVDPGCRTALILACEGSVAAANGDLAEAIEDAQTALEVAKAALEVKRLADMAAIVSGCAVTAVTGLGYLACVAAGIAIFEAKRLALKLAAEAAFDFAISVAIANRDSLIDAAISGANGIRNRASMCFECCSDDPNACCPECMGSETCCEGTCIAEDECCPSCTGSDQCCEGLCISQDECCPSCTGSDVCCEGTCTSDECCLSEDPCCESEDPCCDSEDPCCGSEDPCCGNADPCCGSEDPCCGSSNPCCGSSNPCCGRSSDCDDGGANGDPHMVTFDNVRYSCQGRGEFVLFESLTSGAKVHSLFEKKSEFVSLATGFAATGGGTSPVVELSIPNEDRTSLLMFLDGNEIDPYGGYEDAEILVTEDANTFTVFFKTSQLSVVARYVLITFRHLAVNVRLPNTLRGENIRGMMGSPDDDPSNDWIAADGTVLPLPSTGLSWEAGYEHCVSQWCIRDSQNSLFSYTEEFDFSFYNGCDDPVPERLDLSQASDELRAFCGTNEACLVDGIELGLGGAQSLLDAEAAIIRSSTTSRFRAEPSSVVVDTTFNLVLIVNLTASTEDGVGDIESFAIYQINPNNLEMEGSVLVNLEDIGLGVGEDTIADDLVFSNILAINSATPGEAYSYKAVPVISGIPDPTSPFVLTALNAVQSYSRASGIGQNVDPIGSISVDSIEGLVLVIRYSWPMDQSDLDTSTSFLGSAVGFSCGSSQYMIFSGDNIASGGTETVRVLLGVSFADAVWTNQVFVDMFAGWYGSTNKGPASITVFTETTMDDGSVVVGNNALTFAVDPGAQFGCSSTAVGAASVSISMEGEVTIDIIPAAGGDASVEETQIEGQNTKVGEKDSP